VWSTPSGNGSTKSMSSGNWAIGDYYQFSTSTSGSTGVKMLVDITRSSTGPSGFGIDYSTDGGSTFQTLAGATLSPTNAIVFNNTTEQSTTPPRYLIDFGGALDNISGAVVRIVD